MITNYVDELCYTALPGETCGMTMAASAASMPVGACGYITVNIPPALDNNTWLHVDLVSTNTAVAYPTGAPGGTLTVTFPAGRNLLRHQCARYPGGGWHDGV